MRKKKILFYFCFFLYQAAILIQIYIHQHFEGLYYDLINYLLIFGTIMIVLFFYFRLVQTIGQDARLEAELEALNRQRQLRQEQIGALQKRQADTARFRQKITGQLKHLQSCLRDGDCAQASDYFQEISENFQKIRFRPCCSDSMISAILDSKREMARRQGIDVSYEILLPPKTEVISASLNGIFFNLLDNAAESCLREKSASPFIRLESKINGDFLVIRMINSKPAKEAFSRQTTKKDAAAHGFGLSIIEEITRKHDGTCQWTDHGDTFESVIMLRISH